MVWMIPMMSSIFIKVVALVPHIRNWTFFKGLVIRNLVPVVVTVFSGNYGRRRISVCFQQSVVRQLRALRAVSLVHLSVCNTKENHCSTDFDESVCQRTAPLRLTVLADGELGVKVGMLAAIVVVVVVMSVVVFMVVVVLAVVVLVVARLLLPVQVQALLPHALLLAALAVVKMTTVGASVVAAAVATMMTVTAAALAVVTVDLVRLAVQPQGLG